MRRVTNEIVWAGVAAIVCGIVIASLLGGTETPWWLVLTMIGAGLAVTIVRAWDTTRDPRDAHASRATDDESGTETPRERREVETGARSTLGTRNAESLRRAGARSESLRTGPAPHREDDSTR